MKIFAKIKALFCKQKQEIVIKPETPIIEPVVVPTKPKRIYNGKRKRE